MGFNGGISRSEMLPHNVNKIIVHVHVYLTFCKSYLFLGALRAGPNFVSAHTFCLSHKAWFNHHVHTRVGIDIQVISYATKYMT